MNEPSSDRVFQYVQALEEAADRYAQRIEALERLLVEKGVVLSEELNAALQRYKEQARRRTEQDR